MRLALTHDRHDLVVTATSAALCALAAHAGDAHGQTMPRTGGSGSAVRRLDEDMTTARAMALGGRGEAGGGSTTALFANPAAASSMRTYHVDSWALYDPTVGRFGIGSGVMDSTRSLISGGFAYTFNTISDGPKARMVHDGRLVVGLNLGQHVGLGVRGRYLNVSGGEEIPVQGMPAMMTSLAGPAAPDATGLSREPFSGFTFDTGLHVHPAREVSLSVTGYNLNNVNTTAAPISLGTGAAVSPIRELSIVADVLLDFRSTNAVRGRYSGGVELFIANKYAIRGGYMFDDTRGGSQAFTLGAGYVDPRFGIELAYRQAVVPDMQSTLMVSVRYFYQAATQQAQAQDQSTQTQTQTQSTSQ